jgi:hypothetical protein
MVPAVAEKVPASLVVLIEAAPLVITVPVVAEGALPLQTVKSKFCAVVEVATVIVPVAGAVKLNQTSPPPLVQGEL